METGIIILLCVILVASFAIGVLILLELKEISGYLEILELELRQINQSTTRLHHDFVNWIRSTNKTKQPWQKKSKPTESVDGSETEN